MAGLKVVAGRVGKGISSVFGELRGETLRALDFGLVGRGLRLAIRTSRGLVDCKGCRDWNAWWETWGDVPAGMISGHTMCMATGVTGDAQFGVAGDQLWP
jgi:hypothetical protein